MFSGLTRVRSFFLDKYINTWHNISILRRTAGLYYLRARYMNPATGTFISMDTYGGSVFDPVSLHKYLYANANPVSYTDPSGYFSLAEVAVTVAISTVLMSVTGAVFGGLLEAFRQHLIDPNAKLDWNKILEAAATGAIWGAVIGFVAGLAEFFVIASLVMSGIMLFFAGMSFRQAKLDWDEYHNWKLVALDIVLGILSLIGAGKYAAKAKGLYDAKQAAKAAKTAESNTDTSPENTNTAGGKSGTNDSKNPIFGDEWKKYFNEKYGKGNVNWDTAKIEDILSDPSRIVDFTPEQLAEMARKSGWSVEPLGKGSKAGIPYEDGSGYSMRAPNGRSEYIQYHPGGGHHGEPPYYKVSSGPTGTLRFFLGDD